MAIDGKKIVKAYDALRNGLANRIATLTSAAPFIDPSRGLATSDTITEHGTWTQDVYDSHAQTVADLSAHYIQAKSKAQGRIWFGFKERREWLNKEDDVKEWLEHCAEVGMAHINRSNFYQSDLQITKDFWSWGPGGGLMEERQFLPYRPAQGYRGLHLSCDMIGRFVAGWDSWGKVNRYGIERMWTADAAAQRFGVNNLSEKIRGKLDKPGAVAEKFKFIHYISPRDGEYGDKAKQKMPWKWCWVEHDGGHVCEEGGYEKMRALVPRQGGMFGEEYGRGRADIALNDVMTKNTARRLELEAAALKIRPPTFTRAGALFGAQSLVPGSWPVINQVTPNRPLSDNFHTYGGDGDLTWAQVTQDELKKSISEVFFVDHLRQAIALEGKHQQTAFERAQLEREILSLIGPIYAPYTFQFTDPFIELLFDDLYQAGEFGDPPEILLNEGGQIDVVYDSPLTAVQAADEVQVMLEFQQQMAFHSEWFMKNTGKPSPALDLVDWTDFHRTLAEKMKVPAGPIRSGREVALIAESKAQEERNQVINSELAGGAEAMGKMAPFLKAMQEQ